MMYVRILWTACNAIIHSTNPTADQTLLTLQEAVLAWYSIQSEHTTAGRSLLIPPSDSKLNCKLLAHFITAFTPYTQDIRSFTEM